MAFRDRREAGRLLGQSLRAYAHRSDVSVLALPRGGVPVAFEVANTLAAPLDVFVVRKLGVPGDEELALGAIASGGTLTLNREVIDRLGLTEESIARVLAEETRELARRERLYRGERPALDVRNGIVILVDDGAATGSSMRAALRALQNAGPRRVVVAVPTAPAEVCAALAREADEVVCPLTPEPFVAVGLSYRNFSQTSDQEVRALLAAAQRPSTSEART
jgi:predicted phosphoribosyltransferase